ncbi:MAG: cyclic nucleotide-binding domain-containing protein [Polyangiaceae bacterium]|nr:cyclic nucleotide-binding domain-containing protein [Polyangiaceae bacterium]
MTAPDVERLREVGLFGGLNDEALESLGHAHEVVSAPVGSDVFREGEPGREMFVVLEGQVELYRVINGYETIIASVAKNDWFGEMSMLDILPRQATARVILPTTLLRLTAHDLDVLYRRDLKAYSLLVLNMAREMSRRLRLADAIVADMRALHRPPPGDPSHSD